MKRGDVLSILKEPKPLVCRVPKFVFKKNSFKSLLLEKKLKRESTLVEIIKLIGVSEN